MVSSTMTSHDPESAGSKDQTAVRSSPSLVRTSDARAASQGQWTPNRWPPGSSTSTLVGSESGTWGPENPITTPRRDDGVLPSTGQSFRFGGNQMHAYGQRNATTSSMPPKAGPSSNSVSQEVCQSADSFSSYLFCLLVYTASIMVHVEAV